MKIGPVDIRNHEFSKKMRGVDDAEVRAYLDLVADRLEEVILEADALRGRLARLEAQMQEYSTLEESLRSSLISAKQISDERIGAADREARIILKNAEVDAEKVVVGARGELARLRAELDDLRRQKLTYVERFRALLRSQVKILEASVESLDPDDDHATIHRIVDGVEPAVGQYLGEEGLFSQEPPGDRR